MNNTKILDTKRLAVAIHNLSHILAEVIADHPEPLIEGLTKQETLNELQETVHDILLPLVCDAHADKCLTKQQRHEQWTGNLPRSNDKTIKGHRTTKKHLHLKLVKC